MTKRFLVCFLLVLSATHVLSADFVNVQGPNGKNYIGDLERRYNADARTYCASFGGHLPRPRTMEEINFLKAFISHPNRLWLDGKSPKGLHSYVNEDGTEFPLTESMEWYLSIRKCSEDECYLSLWYDGELYPACSIRKLRTLCEVSQVKSSSIQNRFATETPKNPPTLQNGIPYSTSVVVEKTTSMPQAISQHSYLPSPQFDEIKFRLSNIEETIGRLTSRFDEFSSIKRRSKS